MSGQGLKLGLYKRIHFAIKEQKVTLRYVFLFGEINSTSRKRNKRMNERMIKLNTPNRSAVNCC